MRVLQVGNPKGIYSQFEQGGNMSDPRTIRKQISDSDNGLDVETTNCALQTRHRTTLAGLGLAAALLLAIVTRPNAQAQTFTVLHNFTGGNDGENPIWQPVVDENGNIYGTDIDFGSGCCGIVWEYSAAGSFSVVHSFNHSDGAAPYGLRLNKNEDIIGTTAGGGSHGGGTVFEITSEGIFTTLYNFGSEYSGPSTIDDGVTVDANGNMYGASVNGGASGNCNGGCGTVWKLSRAGSATVLHSFDGNDGANPVNENLKLDKHGNLYGLAQGGGSYGYGTLFEIAPRGAFRVLHDFANDGDGCLPTGSLVEYKRSLFGTTAGCVPGSEGTVWQYNIKSAKFTVLHTFSGADGSGPNGVGCQQGKKTVCAGNLFGTTYKGGTNNVGTVWEIDASGVFSTLYNFADSDGATPWDRPFVYKDGNLYGTTTAGGSYGNGTLWEIKAMK
jgi:uncharacterized repeat protein (TIGR03803 family)